MSTLMFLDVREGLAVPHLDSNWNAWGIQVTCLGALYKVNGGKELKGMPVPMLVPNSKRGSGGSIMYRLCKMQ